MSDHLPECPLLEPCDDDIPEHGYCSMQRGAFCIHCHQWCICERLRACEQRAYSEAAEEMMRGTIRLENTRIRDEGYAAGVQAAYSAVELRWQKVADAASDWLLVALAAIDALREDING